MKTFVRSCVYNNYDVLSSFDFVLIDLYHDKKKDLLIKYKDIYM